MLSTKKIAMGALGVGLFAAAVTAAPTVRFADTEGNWNANDGFLVDLGADGSYEYTSFCVEIQEPIAMGTIFEYGISTSVMNRGGDGPLSLDTATGHAIAFLYSQFRSGSTGAIEGLSGLNGMSDSQARELTQRTIWNKLYGGHTSGYFTQGKIDLLFSAAMGQWTSLHNVRVMNIWVDADGQTGARQDLLTMVPLPSSAGLAGLGLLGLAGRGRRR